MDKEKTKKVLPNRFQRKVLSTSTSHKITERLLLKNSKLEDILESVSEIAYYLIS